MADIYDDDDYVDDDSQNDVTEHNVASSQDENCDVEDNEESENNDSILNRNPSFTGDGWDCTCSGSCLCKYYEPKGTYNTDCYYCGHGIGSHRKR